jgi:UDP-GlcNAc:undecaprenyl-phosphate GlcNAc-1-phosphate transferase
LIGFLDDKFDVSPRLKFLFIFLASIVLYMHDVQINTLGSYFGYDFLLPFWVIFPFTFFAIAGFTNSLNLMDGLDGLAGSIAFIILSAFLAIGVNHNDVLMITLTMTFMACIGAFLLFNWNPAIIFMGDSGSLTIGFTIALLSVLSLQYINPPAVLFIIALPLLDTFIVITRRLQRGVSPFCADKNHIHHFLYNVKGDVRFVVILLASIQGAFTLIGYQLRNSDSFISLVLFCLLFFIFLHLFDQRLKRRRKPGERNKQLTAIRNKMSIKPKKSSKPIIIDEQSVPAMVQNTPNQPL